MRKIIQISCSSDQLFALCDDGTVWANQRPSAYNGGVVWRPLDDITQDDEPEADDA